jgi:hypothetical protein
MFLLLRRIKEGEDYQELVMTKMYFFNGDLEVQNVGSTCCQRSIIKLRKMDTEIQRRR